MKKPTIVIINGISQAGKDTFCFLCSLLCSTIVLSTVDEVKLIASNIFGWDGIKDEKGRQLLSNLRAAWNAYNHGSTDSVINTIQTGACDTFDLIFVMIRERDEMEYFANHPNLSMYNIIDMWVSRLYNIPGPTEANFVRMLDGYTFDHTMLNHGSLYALYTEAEKFVTNVVQGLYDTTYSPEEIVTMVRQFDTERNYTLSNSGDPTHDIK